MFRFCVYKTIGLTVNITVFSVVLIPLPTSLYLQANDHIASLFIEVTSDIGIFSDQSILTYSLDMVVIAARGEPEAGWGRGVPLDVLMCFWQECFTALTTGSNEKIPYIRHDLQKAEWEAIARVLVYGYLNMKYFPLQLSHLFVASYLFGEESITPEFLLKSFREYIAAEDREVLDLCLRHDFHLQDDDGNDNDDVLEVLSTFKCFRIPNKDNIRSIISELAHQELIYKPRYVFNC